MSALPKAQVDQLKLFVQMLKSKPDILHDPALDFLRDFIVSMGGTVPPKKQVWTLAQFLACTLLLRYMFSFRLKNDWLALRANR